MSSLRIRRLLAAVVLAVGLVLLPVAAHAVPLTHPGASVADTSVSDAGGVVDWLVTTVASFFGYGPVETPTGTDGRAPEVEEADGSPQIDISGAR